MAQRTDTRQNLLTSEFVIVVKFGGHALCHLASRLARQGGRQTKNLVLAIFKKIRT